MTTLKLIEKNVAQGVLSTMQAKSLTKVNIDRLEILRSHSDFSSFKVLRAVTDCEDQLEVNISRQKKDHISTQAFCEATSQWPIEANGHVSYFRLVSIVFLHLQHRLVELFPQFGVVWNGVLNTDNTFSFPKRQKIIR